MPPPPRKKAKISQDGSSIAQPPASSGTKPISQQDRQKAFDEYKKGAESYKSRRFEEAILHLTNAIDLDQSKCRYLIYRASIYWDWKDFANAKIDCDRVIELEPNNVYAIYCRGLAYLDMKDVDAGRRDFRRVLDMDPKFSIVQRQMDELKKLESMTMDQPMESGHQVNEKVTNLEETLKQKEEELRNVREQLQKQLSDVKEMETKLQQLHEEKSTLQRESEAKKNLRPQLNQQKEELEKHMQELEVRLKDEQKRVEKIKEDRKKLLVKQQDLEESLKEEEKARHKLQQDKNAVDQKRKKIEETLGRTKNGHEKLIKEKKVLEDLNTDLTSKLAEEKRNWANVKAKYEAQIADLEKQLAKECRARQGLEKTKCKSETELSDLKKQLSEKDEKLEEFQQLLAKRDEDLASALTKCNDETTAKSTLSQQIRQLKSGLETEKQARLKADQQKRDYAQRLDKTTEQLENAKKTQQQVEKTNSVLEAERNELLNQVKTTQVTNQEMHKRLQQVKSVLVDLDKAKVQGDQFFQNRQFKKAIECYTTAIKIDRSNPTLHCNRAMAYLKLKNYYICAKSDCDDAIRLDPECVIAYCHRAKAHLGMKENMEARADLRRVLQLEPSNRWAEKELKKLPSKWTIKNGNGETDLIGLGGSYLDQYCPGWMDKNSYLVSQFPDLKRYGHFHEGVQRAIENLIKKDKISPFLAIHSREIYMTLGKKQMLDELFPLEDGWPMSDVNFQFLIVGPKIGVIIVNDNESHELEMGVELIEAIMKRLNLNIPQIRQVFYSSNVWSQQKSKLEESEIKVIDKGSDFESHFNDLFMQQAPAMSKNGYESLVKLFVAILDMKPNRETGEITLPICRK